jgi:mRNA-degrading endonuclease RelE of RelBE toxin-antitoxin system
LADGGSFRIAVKPDAAAELNGIRVFDRRRIVDDMKSELKTNPDTETKRKKRLDGVVAGFPFEPPLWELKVGDYRVYYDVNSTERTVYVRAIRFKGSRSTDEVLR